VLVVGTNILKANAHGMTKRRKTRAGYLFFGFLKKIQRVASTEAASPSRIIYL
jgi:hypothetical protein